MNGRVLVACIGNIFLGDDAFGVEVARRLAARAFPEHVRVVDFGIRSYDLAYALMDDWELVILVDALPRGGAPGTVYTIEPNVSEMEGPPEIDAHTMNPVSVLQMVAALGGHPRRILVVGCEPESVAPDDNGQIGLSAPVQAAVDLAVQTIEELIAHSTRATAA